MDDYMKNHVYIHAESVVTYIYQMHVTCLIFLPLQGRASEQEAT